MTPGPNQRDPSLGLEATPGALTSDTVSGSTVLSSILVVEPDGLVRDALKALLGGLYRLECAESPADALSTLRRGAFDAVVSETQLPGMTAGQFWQHLHSIDPELRLVLHGSVPPGNDWTAIGTIGQGEFLRKPADSASVRAAVARNVESTASARRMAFQVGELERLNSEMAAAKLERNLYAGILHDINGPLTVISSLADALLHDLAKFGDREASQTARDLIDQANLCIDISRLSIGYARHRPPDDHCDIAKVLGDLDRLLHFHPASRGQTLVVHPFYLPVQAVTDTTTVFRILLNLGLNGLQSAKVPHRVEIFGWVLHERITGVGLAPVNTETLWWYENFENRPPFIAICVRDSGPGIPSEMLQTLFVQGMSTKAEGSGSGLGMGIVHQCVRQAGGAISVETRPGKGSSFVVYLPAIQRV